MAGDNVLLRALQAPPPELPGRDFGEQDTFLTSLIDMVILANPHLAWA